MPVDLTELNAAIAATVDEATQLDTLAPSIAALLNGQAAAIVAAVAADNSINAANTAAVTATVKTVNDKFISNIKILTDAATANTPAAPPVAP